MGSCDNPWEVESIQSFAFLNCPECTFKSKEETLFQEHAVTHHPLCFVLFGSFVQEVTIEDQKPDLNEPAIEYYVEIKGDEVPSKLELESALASITEKDTKPVIIQKSTNTVHTAVVQGDLLWDIVNWSGTAWPVKGELISKGLFQGYLP